MTMQSDRQLVGRNEPDDPCVAIRLVTRTRHFLSFVSIGNHPLESYPELKLGMRLMDAKTFSLVAGVIFAVVALFHLVRIFLEWTVTIGDWSIPMWASWIALVVAGGLALLGLRLSER